MAQRKPFNEFWKLCKCLIIDEISMVSSDYFSKLEAVARAMKNNQQPFGNIQLILCGDFYQLAPVVQSFKLKTYKSPSDIYCFNVNFNLNFSFLKRVNVGNHVLTVILN